MVRAALALAVAGIVAVVSGALMFFTAGSASSVPTTTETPCVPSDAWTETTDWVLVSPGEGWRQVDQRTVVDREAYDEVVTPAVDTWWHWNGSNQGVPPPPPPATGWNTDEGNHEGLKLKPDYAPNKVFDASIKGGDNASWFYHQLADAVVVHHEAVTHEEFRFAFDHPAVVCPTEPPTTQPPTTQPPTTQPPTAQPPEVLPTTATPSVQPSDEPSEEPSEEATEEPSQQPSQQPDDTEVLGVEASQPPTPQAQVPTVVDAGLASVPDGGTPAARQWGVVLLAGGMVLLASSGGLLVAARRA